jgi:RNA polymerase sigma factor (sigma-70 family)
MTQCVSEPATGLAPDCEEINWNKVLGEHDRWLRTVVYARLGEPQAVDDVMQDVALAAVRQSAPLQDRSRVAPWLYRLAVRQTLLYRRKMGRGRNLTHRYAERFRPVESDTRDPGPLEWLLSLEAGSLIRKAIATLRNSDSEILLLKYAQNWNYHQIAEHLGIGHSAVEARLHRARARMRKELERLSVIEASE